MGDLNKLYDNLRLTEVIRLTYEYNFNLNSNEINLRYLTDSSARLNNLIELFNSEIKKFKNNLIVDEMAESVQNIQSYKRYMLSGENLRQIVPKIVEDNLSIYHEYNNPLYRDLIYSTAILSLTVNPLPGSALDPLIERVQEYLLLKEGMNVLLEETGREYSYLIDNSVMDELEEAKFIIEDDLLRSMKTDFRLFVRQVRDLELIKLVKTDLGTNTISEIRFEFDQLLTRSNNPEVIKLKNDLSQVLNKKIEFEDLDYFSKLPQFKNYQIPDIRVVNQSSNLIVSYPNSEKDLIELMQYPDLIEMNEFYQLVNQLKEVIIEHNLIDRINEYYFLKAILISLSPSADSYTLNEVINYFQYIEEEMVANYIVDVLDDNLVITNRRVLEDQVRDYVMELIPYLVNNHLVEYITNILFLNPEFVKENYTYYLFNYINSLITQDQVDDSDFNQLIDIIHVLVRPITNSLQIGDHIIQRITDEIFLTRSAPHKLYRWMIYYINGEELEWSINRLDSNLHQQLESLIDELISPEYHIDRKILADDLYEYLRIPGGLQEIEISKRMAERLNGKKIKAGLPGLIYIASTLDDILVDDSYRYLPVEPRTYRYYLLTALDKYLPTIKNYLNKNNFKQDLKNGIIYIDIALDWNIISRDCKDLYSDIQTAFKEFKINVTPQLIKAITNYYKYDGIEYRKITNYIINALKNQSESLNIMVEDIMTKQASYLVPNSKPYLEYVNSIYKKLKLPLLPAPQIKMIEKLKDQEMNISANIMNIIGLNLINYYR